MLSPISKRKASETYLQKLKDPRWQKKRLQILERDEWKCRLCESEHTTLHVHHLAYRKGADPWDYTKESLVTLCESCHEWEHECRTEAENQLLSALRNNGVLFDDVASLANVLETMPEEYKRRMNDIILVIDCLLDTRTLDEAASAAHEILRLQRVHGNGDA